MVILLIVKYDNMKHALNETDAQYELRKLRDRLWEQFTDPRYMLMCIWRN